MGTPRQAISGADARVALARTLSAIIQRLATEANATAILSCVDTVRHQSPPTVRSWAALGQALVAAGWLYEAEATFCALAASYPTEPAGTVGQARVAARRHNWHSALELWTSCLDRFAAAAKPAWRAERATALMRLGRLDAAETAFRNLTESHPNFHPGFVGLAQIATRQRNWDIAQDRWAACLERFPAEATEVWRMAHGNALLELGRCEDAATLYCAVLHASPDHPTAALRLATVATSANLRAREALMAAAVALERSAEHEPGNGDLRLRLGTLLQTTGRLDLAFPHFKEAIRQRCARRPATTQYSGGSAPRNTGEIHLVSPFVAVGGRTGRCIELFRALEGKCPVRLWTLAEFGPPASIFAERFAIETIALEADRYPRHGTLVLVGPDMALDWLHASDPDRVIQICNYLNPSVMISALDAYENAGIREVEFVYASELIRDATGLPGTVQQSLIDLDRFAPQSREPREPSDFSVGRLSRDVLVKHSPDDPELYRALAKAGCHVRLMGAMCLEQRLRGAEGVELLPAQGDGAVDFLRGLDCFLYRTSNAWVEPSGRVVSEAMACGLPVVCHRNGGYREIIQDGKNGFLFDTNAEAEDIVLRLKTDRELRYAVGIAARQTAESLNGPAARQAIVDFYLGRTP
jgi:glycosyltransferase involved in cell wall biosynthesis/tetratricopeptide (TPR) repeat protein